MPGIDELRANLLHEVMSRPIRLFLPTACAVLSLGFTACVGTVYDRMYSNKKTYFKPPAEKKEASAEDILKDVGGAQPSLDAGAPAPGADALGVPPAPAGDIPGLPPAMPDAAAPAPAPAVPPPPL